jgi:putative flippase GtrA
VQSGSTIAPIWSMALGLPRPLRAIVAGGAATFVDLAVLFVLVTGFGVAPRMANVPSLVLGAVVGFFANRHFVFRAGRGSLPKQAALYVIVELLSLALNAVLFDLAVRLLAQHASLYVPARLVTSHLVFLGFSYPLWRFVFRVPRVPQAV